MVMSLLVYAVVLLMKMEHQQAWHCSYGSGEICPVGHNCCFLHQQTRSTASLSTEQNFQCDMDMGSDLVANLGPLQPAPC